MKFILSPGAEKDLDKLNDELVIRISKKLKELILNPFSPDSKKLVGKQGYRVRVGDYRVIYEVDKANKLIAIIKVAHRKEVYR